MACRYVQLRFCLRSIKYVMLLSHELYASNPCYPPFCYILKQKMEIDLPNGQASHVLRHTFASHFMMNSGNILVLRDILGHADIKMTMRYSHFAPDHLAEAITKNPISNLAAMNNHAI
ncbi:integrase [Vibrio genomosp. F6]|nr:integrase [Vibrio genomosp. F6]